MNEATDFYSILGVARTATTDTIKEAFRFLSHAYHPDKFATEEQRNKAEERFKKINESYSVLSDPTARARYDASRIGLSDPWSNYPPDIPESIVPDMPMWQQVLRWIAVLPAAIGAYFAVQIAVAIASGFVNGFDDRPDYRSQFISSIVGPYFLVLAGAKTAPTFRFVTVLALTVLHAIFNGSVVTLAIVRGTHQSFSLWWLILCGVVGIIASIVACIQMRKEEDTA